MDPKQAQLRGSGRPILRWAVNTTAWSPSRTEWVTAMRLVGSDEECRRINRFVFKRDAKHALVGRLLIRKCCRHFLDAAQHQQLFNSSPSESSVDQQQPNRLRMARSGKGKPILLQKSEDKIRLQIELEFVQCLANPNYLNYLAQRGYFKDKAFINYLDYLQYWKRPEYAKFIKYPMCLHFLDLLQAEHFRRELTSTQCSKFIDDQIILHWHHYARKRTKLFSNVAQQQQQQQGPQKPTVQQPENLNTSNSATSTASAPPNQQQQNNHHLQNNGSGANGAGISGQSSTTLLNGHAKI